VTAVVERSGAPAARTRTVLTASLIGTTGASVLLVRPLLRANASRAEKAHVVVFFMRVSS